MTWDDRDVTAEAAGRVWSLRRVDVGTKHGVTLLPEQLDEALFQAAGPALERASVFPDRANIEFITLEGPDHLKMRVWERGSGETLACGTGACASFVAAYLAGWVGRRATVSLRGGDLFIEWGEDDHVHHGRPGGAGLHRRVARGLTRRYRRSDSPWRTSWWSAA